MNHLLLWGKTPRTENGFQAEITKYHPLLFHMLDAAAVAQTLWDEWLAPNIKKRFEYSLGDEARKQVIFFSGIHDLGKGTPGFQKKSQILSAALDLRFSRNDQTVPHGMITARLLRELFPSDYSYKLLGRIAGGHHGVYPRSIDLQNIGGVGVLGNNEWNKTRQELLHAYSNMVQFDLNKASAKKLNDAALPHLLAGFITVADWIASDQDFFPCAATLGQQLTQVEDYWAEALKKANNALKDLGWLPKVIFEDEKAFKDIFKTFSPNTLQNSVSDLIAPDNKPYMIIVEAPMGLGKTEAALYAADLALCRSFARGIYIAMPTQATSNAMFARVRGDYLQNRGHKGNLNLQLVHGDALLASVIQNDQGQVIKDCPSIVGENGINIEAQSWFTGKKRPLLAPFGVGTIDQSLLSVLQTKHWFLRAFGLAGKVIIFDEVHAYDTYMSTILDRLLGWLAELGCTVILLSATLPDGRKKALVEAYSGLDDIQYQPYPRVTKCPARSYPSKQADEHTVCVEVPLSETKTVGLQFISEDDIVSLLQNKIAGGGCAAIICNTVGSAQAMYRKMQDSLPDTEILLFHARMKQGNRREREKEVLSKFGKGEKEVGNNYKSNCRPIRAVLVATQVIEQSLDLDFDLMISEIAPVDLLLQRLGRLHRHQRCRPGLLSAPEFIVLCGSDVKGAPPESFGQNIEYVYERYILLRTWYALRERNEISIPGDIEHLVKMVYDDYNLTEDIIWCDMLSNAKQKVEISIAEDAKKARTLLVAEPMDPSDHMEKCNYEFEDDEDPFIHSTVKAATRLGDPSVTVVFLPEGTELKIEQGLKDVQGFLDHSVKISHKGLFHQLLKYGETPIEWSKIAHLRNVRLLWLSRENKVSVGDFELEVNCEVGLVISKREG
jgi:CRISPR-associated endonuclease/helicase Cas3